MLTMDEKKGIVLRLRKKVAMTKVPMKRKQQKKKTSGTECVTVGT